MARPHPRIPFRRTAKVLLLGGLLVLLARNWIAVHVVQSLASRILEHPVDVEQIQIGFHTISLHGVTVADEADSTAPLVQVRHLEIVPSLLQGIRHGVWAERVTIDEPSLTLRFAHDGTLLTRLPQPHTNSRARNSTLPFRQLDIRRAAVSVHQVNRQPLAVANVSLTLLAAAELLLQTEIPNLLGANVRVCSKLDAQTFAGQTQVSIPAFHGDTNALDQLALVPQSLTNWGVQANASVFVAIQHPPHTLDPTQHHACVAVSINDVTSRHAGTLLSSLQISLTHAPEQTRCVIDARGLDGTAKLDGKVELDATAKLDRTVNLAELPFSAEFVASVTDCNIAKLVSHFQPSVAASSTLQGDITGSARFDGQRLTFTTTTTVSAEHTRLHLAKRSDANATTTASTCELATFQCRAAGVTQPGDWTRIDGHVTGNMVCSAIQLAPLVTLTPLAALHRLDDLNGSVALQADFDLPLDWHDLATRGVATAHMTTHAVTAAGIRVDDSRLTVHLADALARVSCNEMQLHDAATQHCLANLSGHIESAIDAGNPLHSILTTRLHATVPSLDKVARAAKLSFADRDATVAGNVDARVDTSVDTSVDASIDATLQSQVRLDRIADAGAWSADAELAAHSILALGEPLQDIVVLAALRDGKVDVPKTQTHWRDTELTMAATADLRDAIRSQKVRVDGEFTVGPLAVAEVAAVASQFSSTPLRATGTVSTHGHLRLTTSPLELVAGGSATLDDAAYAGHHVGNANLDWNFRDRSLKITSHSDELLGGNYVATATMRELDWSRASIDAQCNELSVARLAAFLPSQRLADLNLPCTGTVSGGMSVTSIADWQTLSGTAWMQTHSLSVHAVPLEVERFALVIDEGRCQSTAEGTVAEGTFVATASSSIQELVQFACADVDPTAPQRLAELPVIAQCQVSDVSLQRLALAAGWNRRDVPVRANVNLTIERHAGMSRDGALCHVVASLERLRWHHDRLSSLITATAVVEPERVVLRSIVGRFADGRLAGNGELRFASGIDGQLTASASRVNLRRAAAPLGALGKRLSGSGDVSIRARLGRTITGDAKLATDHVILAGLSVPRVRIPVDWSYALDSRTLRWKSRSGLVEAGNGEVRITSDGSYNRYCNMNLHADISHVDSSRLLVARSLGGGIVNGRVALHAKQASSLKQVSGTFNIELAHIKALEIPVLSELPHLIRLPSLSSFGDGPQLDGGTIDGRLANCVVHIDQIALRQRNLQLLVDGTSTIDGRLDLNVTASTDSTSPTEGLMGIINSPLMLAAPAPVALIAKANELMKDRVVHVHVGGTPTRPLLRIQAGKALTQDAIRFFLSNTFGSRVADVTTSPHPNKRYVR